MCIRDRHGGRHFCTCYERHRTDAHYDTRRRERKGHTNCAGTVPGLLRRIRESGTDALYPSIPGGQETIRQSHSGSRSSSPSRNGNHCDLHPCSDHDGNGVSRPLLVLHPTRTSLSCGARGASSPNDVVDDKLQHRTPAEAPQSESLRGATRKRMNDLPCSSLSDAPPRMPPPSS